MATVAVEPDFEATLFLASADCFDVVDVGGTVVLQKNKKNENYQFDLGTIHLRRQHGLGGRASPIADLC